MRFSNRFLILTISSIFVFLSSAYGLTTSLSGTDGLCFFGSSITFDAKLDNFVSGTTTMGLSGGVEVSESLSTDASSDPSFTWGNYPSYYARVWLDVTNPDGPYTFQFDKAPDNAPVGWANVVTNVPSAESITCGVEAKNPQSDFAQGITTVKSTTTNRASLDYIGEAQVSDDLSTHFALAKQTINSAKGDLEIKWNAFNANGQLVDGYASVKNAYIPAGIPTTAIAKAGTGYAEASLDLNNVRNGKGYTVFSMAKKNIYSKSSSTISGGSFRRLDADVYSKATTTSTRNSVIVRRG